MQFAAGTDAQRKKGIYMSTKPQTDIPPHRFSGANQWIIDYLVLLFLNFFHRCLFQIYLS